MADSAFAQRQSGLYVPTAPLQRSVKTMLEEDFKKFKRAMRFAHESGITMRYFCDNCKKPIKLTKADQIVVTDAAGKLLPGGRYTLECPCTTWTIR